MRDVPVKLKVSDSQNFWRGKGVWWQFYSKSTVYKSKWALKIFWEWHGQRANKICTIEPGGGFKGEEIGLDVQELTDSNENMNVKSLNSTNRDNMCNHKNCNFLDWDWFEKLLFSTNSLAKFRDSLLLESVLLDSLFFQSYSLKQPITFKVVIMCVRVRAFVFLAPNCQ